MITAILTALVTSSSLAPPSLDLMCVDEVFPPLLSSIAYSLYEFSGGDKGTNIGDGVCAWHSLCPTLAAWEAG